MTDAEPPNTQSPIDSHTADQFQRNWQFGLRTLLLVMVAITVWLAFFNNRWQIASLEARIMTMQHMAHELVIGDPNRIAIVKLEEMWHNDHRWDVYLPEGQYRLCLATQEVDVQGLAPITKSVMLSGGRHRFGVDGSLKGDTWRAMVSKDGKSLFEVEQPDGLGVFERGDFLYCTQLPADQPVVLFRRRYIPVKNTFYSEPSGPAEGVLLWLERTGDSAARSQ